VKIALFGHGGMGRVLERAPAPQPRRRRHLYVCQRRRSARLLPGHAVAIDFSAPAAVPAHVAAAAAAGVPLVQGTTGWQREEAAVRNAVEARGAALVYGANFSIGVNLFYRIVADAARLFAARGTIRSSRRRTTPASATRRRGPRWRCRPSCHAVLGRSQGRAFQSRAPAPVISRGSTASGSTPPPTRSFWFTYPAPRVPAARGIAAAATVGAAGCNQKDLVGGGVEPDAVDPRDMTGAGARDWNARPWLLPKTA